MLKYTVYADKDMTRVAKEIETANPATVDAMRYLLQSGGILDVDNLPLPYRFELVGVVIHSF